MPFTPCPVFAARGLEIQNRTQWEASTADKTGGQVQIDAAGKKDAVARVLFVA